MENIYKKYSDEYKSNLIKRKGQQYDQQNGAVYSDKEIVFGVDDNGFEVTNFAVQQILLNIIDEFKRVCDKHNIPFALGFGTALGMYNYKGFIPWDDDADIIIHLDDLPRLVKALEEDLSDDYVCDCFETDNRYTVLNPTMKIRYKHSYIREKNYKRLPNRSRKGDGIFIDVCAFSWAPKSNKTHKILRMNSFLITPYYLFMDTLLKINPILNKKRLKRFERRINEKYRNSGYVSQSIIIAWQGLNTYKKQTVFPYEMFYPFVEREFEGRMLPFINDLEGFFKIKYGEDGMKKFIDGEWRDLYPEEKRVTEHIDKIAIYK